ncbi:hypothetical protein ACFO3O_01615 [Dokdonia ponticola]|uniref:GLPGLI family protein n=1 Tax=Dokdonia ponticola TaxID=2041041 RepID=A0ABV9HSX5_9FLAO
MKSKIILASISILLFIMSTNAQIQKNFFVDDANGVDFVRFNVCVNDEAKIYKVEVIPDKTTYTNETIIKQLKEYLLGIQFYPDSTLRNNCYETTSTLVNSKYQDATTKGQKIEKGFPFLKGDFRYKNPVYSISKVKRKKHVQREIGTHDKQIYTIEWLSTREYTLIYKRMTRKQLKQHIGKSINVEILEVFPDSSYVYKSTGDHFDWTTYGVMKKIK